MKNEAAERMTIMRKDKVVWFEIYPDKASKWRWRAKAPNGRIIADSGESYTRKPDARRAIENFCEAVVFGACDEGLELRPQAIREIR